jgi:tripartite-type tricarboxylate transporter receptor subunit TctC
MWGKPVVVEHRPGGGTIIGSHAVAKAAPDGHTLGLNTASFVIQPALRRTMPFDAQADFEFITPIMETPFILTVNASMPIRSHQDLVAYAKANPNKLNIGSFGIGSTPHILAEIMTHEAGIRIVHVPFKGSPDGMAAQLAGDVPLNFDVVMSPMPHIKAAKLRPLLVTSPTRYPGLPEVPTAAEVGVGALEMTAWFGLIAPAKVPGEVIAYINSSVAKVLHTKEIRDALATRGMSVRTSSPEEFRRFVATSMQRIQAAVETAGIPKTD